MPSAFPWIKNAFLRHMATYSVHSCRSRTCKRFPLYHLHRWNNWHRKAHSDVLLCLFSQSYQLGILKHISFQSGQENLALNTQYNLWKKSRTCYKYSHTACTPYWLHNTRLHMLIHIAAKSPDQSTLLQHLQRDHNFLFQILMKEE